jgi:hypothetical protein
MQGEEYWKPLAIKRRYENKAMKGWLRELAESRDACRKQLGDHILYATTDGGSNINI